LIAVSGLVYAGHMSGDESLFKLLEGNKRFISGQLTTKDCSTEKRQELTK